MNDEKITVRRAVFTAHFFTHPTKEMNMLKRAALSLMLLGKNPS
jgi:hypothetical protein